MIEYTLNKPKMYMTLGYWYHEEGTGNGEAWTGTRGIITLVPVPEELF